MTAPQRRILLIDAYDSFTHNLVDQLSRCTGAEVHIIHIDEPYNDFATLLPHLSSFDALVVGPGPGHPSIPKDIGIVKDLWNLPDTCMIPVFGVCLGLQSLCLEFGGVVERLDTVKHGLPSEIKHNGTGLFEGLGQTTAIRYHSLHAKVPENGVLEPLAWATDVENGEVLMAVKHVRHPFYAVQYHPESICTEGGDVVVRNFWRLAMEWSEANGRTTCELPGSWTTRVREPSLLEQIQSSPDEALPEDRAPGTVHTRSFRARGLEPGRVCELLGVETADEFVLLDSAAAPGRWSIIGVLTAGSTELIKYHVGDTYCTSSHVGRKGSRKTPLTHPYSASMWRYLASLMETRKSVGGAEESPFWGGLIGYFSYEIGVDGLDIPLPADRKRRPDANLAWIDRSIVMDTLSGQVYVQSLVAEDDAWLEATKILLQQEHDLSLTPSTTPPPASAHTPTIPRTTPPSRAPPTITLPEKSAYTSLVTASQTHLAAGSSYELCLTARTHIHLPSPRNPWHLYLRLRRQNPAPYAAYLRLQGTTLLSSSPERFLSWTRSGQIQLRPIKGTVRKTPSTTLASASAILNTPKERAENLMILDLIRHDLYRILGPGSVDVGQLMGVEEYKSVYQLVSVINGAIPASESSLTGLDVLASSLPPGSMTGAPKKRSVELLGELESGMEERGVYSGVAGYMSVCGAGDWNVVIRSAWRYDCEGEGEWWIGAGGAVTALSTAEGEWEEMGVKLDSTLGVFQ